MGQIQNAISGAVGSVAIGAIAEQKTKGMKKEIADLDEYMALNHEAIEDQQRELFKKQEELSKTQQELLETQQRHSELKAKTAEKSTRANQKAMKTNKNKHKNKIQLVSVRGKK